MLTGAALDQALAAGYRIGKRNARPVRCAHCGAALLPSQAWRVHLAGRAWRYVFLCDACLPNVPWTSGR